MLNFDKLDRRVDALERAVNERQQTEDLEDIKHVSKRYKMVFGKFVQEELSLIEDVTTNAKIRLLDHLVDGFQEPKLSAPVEKPPPKKKVNVTSKQKPILKKPPPSPKTLSDIEKLSDRELMEACIAKSNAPRLNLSRLPFSNYRNTFEESINRPASNGSMLRSAASSADSEFTRKLPTRFGAKIKPVKRSDSRIEGDSNPMKDWLKKGTNNSKPSSSQTPTSSTPKSNNDVTQNNEDMVNVTDSSNDYESS